MSKDRATRRLRDLARESLSALGGRAGIGSIKDEFMSRLTDAERAAVSESTLNNFVRGLVRDTAGSALPWALSIDGTYVQRPLLTLDERRDLIGRYMAEASRYEAKAYTLAEETKSLFGVWIDPAQAA